MPTEKNFRERLKLGLLFIVFAIVFYIVSSEDLLYYIILVDHPGLQNWKILSLHLLANVGLAISKISIGIMLLIAYHRLRDKNIPFVGFLWIFSIFYVLSGLIFTMNLVSFFRVYIWIDGLIRALAAIFGLAAAYTLYKALPLLTAIKSPEEYGRLADEVHALIQENKKLETILKAKDKEIEQIKK